MFGLFSTENLAQVYPDLLPLSGIERVSFNPLPIADFFPNCQAN